MACSHGICLRLQSGVPVIDLEGDWAIASIDNLSETVRQLVLAGHFDIIVNIQRVAARGASALQSLTALANTVRSHHGHIDIVGTVEQLEQAAILQGQALFRLASSEVAALRRIKGIPVYITEPALKVHL